MLDTGMNARESIETLLEQQKGLLAGKRAVQMFPVNTPELPLPDSMLRVANARGIFHYNPLLISEAEILALSDTGRENTFLDLGPYSKPEVMERIAAGEQAAVITEFTRDLVEVRSVLGCTSTLAEQADYLIRTKAPGSIVICRTPPRVAKALGG